MHARNPEITKFAEQIGRTPSALAMKLTNIASLDPEIVGTGRKGLEGASAADKAMWNEMQSDWERFAVEAENAAQNTGVGTKQTHSLDNIALTDEETDYTGSNRAAVTTIRIGQAFFRKAVLSAYGYKCCITGLSVSKLLVASHIVPWRIDAQNRLNPKNGICLSMLHDKAFDTGIITISEKMTVRVSQKLTTNADPFFKSTLCAYDGLSIAMPEKFHPHAEFLSYHRQHIFEN